ncbi:UbiA prenyltransferase family protein [Haloferax larsenii]|uniref:UbiA prenyltransferase family protein n=2 Tax=Haloferax larsenii TaxID=302484 RepID=A0A1H7QQC5_HALLR|nr:UbiA prenyltransferase family protein [Haloferax larsenii]
MSLHEIRFLFLKLNIWLCLASSLMVAISATALSIPLSSVGVGLVLPPLLFYFIYVEDRRRVAPEDEVNQPYRTELVRRHQFALLVTELLALLGYVALLGMFVLERPDLGVEYLAFGHLPLLVLLVYGHLKQHPTFDSLAVGATWAFVVVFSLLVSTTVTIGWELGSVFVGWFLIAFAGVESRNIQDIDGDSKSNKTTLAGYLGRKPTIALVGVVKSLGVITFWVVSGRVVAGLALCYLVVLRLFRALTRWETAHVGE